jgi:hypothetical protein
MITSQVQPKSGIAVLVTLVARQRRARCGRVARTVGPLSDPKTGAAEAIGASGAAVSCYGRFSRLRGVPHGQGGFRGRVDGRIGGPAGAPVGAR